MLILILLRNDIFFNGKILKGPTLSFLKNHFHAEIDIMDCIIMNINKCF